MGKNLIDGTTIVILYVPAAIWTRCNTELNEMLENRNGKIDKECISWKKSIKEVLLKNKTKSQRGC